MAYAYVWEFSNPGILQNDAMAGTPVPHGGEAKAIGNSWQERIFAILALQFLTFAEVARRPYQGNTPTVRSTYHLIDTQRLTVFSRRLGRGRTPWDPAALPGGRDIRALSPPIG